MSVFKVLLTESSYVLDGFGPLIFSDPSEDTNMLRHREHNESMNFEIVSAINQLLAENVNFDREIRSYHREPFVRPIVVKEEGDLQEEHHCVSRNISPAGICLVSQLAFPENETAVLEIYRLKGMPVDILSECRWSKPFGPNYWMSGCQFVNLKQS